MIFSCIDLESSCFLSYVSWAIFTRLQHKKGEIWYIKLTSWYIKVGWFIQKRTKKLSWNAKRLFFLGSFGKNCPKVIPFYLDISEVLQIKDLQGKLVYIIFLMRHHEIIDSSTQPASSLGPLDQRYLSRRNSRGRWNVDRRLSNILNYLVCLKRNKDLAKSKL